jgi:hypothetical protein
MTVKAVIMEGKNTPKVNMECRNFHVGGTPGSTYWWWKPMGVESTRKSQKERRASESLNILPLPACLGSMAYQEM